MHFVASNHVINHGCVAAKASSSYKNCENIEELKLVLLRDNVLKEVSDAKYDQHCVHHASQNHGDPSHHKLTLMTGNIEI
jgi:hypothetical protein